MTATGVRGVLIIGAKDIADLESAPHDVLARTTPFLPYSNGEVALWAALMVCGHAGAFPQVSCLAAATTYWTRDSVLTHVSGSLSGRDVNWGKVVRA